MILNLYEFLPRSWLLTEISSWEKESLEDEKGEKKEIKYNFEHVEVKDPTVYYCQSKFLKAQFDHGMPSLVL